MTSVLAANGVTIDTAADLQRLMGSDAIGRRVPLLVLRGDNALEIDVVPNELN
jgi:S1-C subfamily serine protease